ncbi:VCBS repeat-containing protein [Actinoplanes sp. NBC_00393]|uniref:FG-GAP repeat domain-containing protein n=1 Tax=Actinoplanes sp. NBC_00393 TaxID=2975953 RepID=UPI002E248CA6
MSVSTRALTRRLLTAGLAAVTLTTVVPAVAHAAPAERATTAYLALADYDEKLAVAVKFGFGDNFELVERDDRDFVVGLWDLLKEDPDFLEVTLAAEQAFTTSDPDDPEAVDRACHEFIVSGVHAAYDRDVAREQRETEAKRLSDETRAAAASSINITAGKALLDATDTSFIQQIWDAVENDADWPKVKAAASAALAGNAEEQQQFIATGLTAAAQQDTADRIAKDEEKTEAEKAAALARAAKQFAANRIGLPVTEQLLALPDRDFATEVWNFAPDGSEVQIAAIETVRSLDPAVWKAFIDTGVHQAKDRDIQKALDAVEAADRKLVQDILARAEAAFQRNLAAAARKALAGTASDVSAFLRTGQYAAYELDRAERLRCNTSGVVDGPNQAGGVVYAVDYTGDCIDDLGNQNPSGQLRAWRATGEIATGKLFVGPSSLVGGGWTATNIPRIVTGDFNGDFKADIIGQASDGKLRAWPSTGTVGENKLFTGAARIVGGGWTTTNIPRIITGDFTGDGKTDIIGQAANGQLRAWASTGNIAENKLFTTAASGIVGSGFTVAAYPRIVTGDFNGDGRTDIIGQAASGELHGFASTGSIADGKLFAAYKVVGGGWTTTNIPRIITGDFNGDGKTDLIGQASDGRLRGFPSSGVIDTGKLFSGTYPIVGAGWTATNIPRIVTGDFNGDGKTDVLGQAANGELRGFASSGVFGDSKLFPGAYPIVGGGWTIANTPRIF